MKITIDVPTLLLRDATPAAAAEGITLAALVERGLPKVIAEHRKGGRFRLPDASVGRHGLQPHAAKLSWAELLPLRTVTDVVFSCALGMRIRLWHSVRTSGERP